MMSEAYNTIDAPASAEYKVSGSRFIAKAKRIDSEHDLSGFIDEIRMQYANATHYCIAAKIGNFTKISDDGEPKNSAGLPIYRQLLSFGLDHTVIIVIRYFGGKKLGVSGLVAAYGEAAKSCLSLCKIVEAVPKITCNIICEPNKDYLVYEFAGHLHVQPEIAGLNTYFINIDSKMTTKLDELKEIFPTLSIKLSNV